MRGSEGLGPGSRAGARSARAHALAVLRVRSTVLALALLPAAAAVILWTGRTTGQFGPGWETARWTVSGFAVAVLACAAVAGLAIARGRPAVSPTVPVEEPAAPDLHALVRDLADRLEVPAPSAIALTPDCDSWLEDRSHARAGGARGAAPVLVIGSPFLWWMRVAELRALLAPVVAGTGPSAHPDIAAARRVVRGLDAAVANAQRPADPWRGDGPAADGPGAPALRAPGSLARVVRGCAAPLRRAVHRAVGPVARLMLRAAGPHAAAMEQGVAAAAADRAQAVDQGLRVAAQEQVGLAYAGWDRLLTRVALPAWRLGLWPTRLDAGVVSALTELSRRDRLAAGFTSRLGERPACDLLKEPGSTDGAVSLLAARLFLGPRPPVPAEAGGQGPAPEWTPVDWAAYPEEVVDRIWRAEAARLFAALDALGPAEPVGASRSAASAAASASAATTSAVPVGRRLPPSACAPPSGGSGAPSGASAEEAGSEWAGPTLARVLDRFAAAGGTDALAARISAEVAREESVSAPGGLGASPGAEPPPGTGGAHLAPLAPMGLPLQPPRSGKELLADHVTAVVCCAAVDTAEAVPGLDWLDGPALYVDGERAGELPSLVLALVEDGEAEGLRDWLAVAGVRPEKPVRLV
ncbi:hypothetical protein [Streptomyces sp. NPDC006784]|uniref:hypothetical protein n=1 Tax=Streptomyces sp. NPDC006784 TaxID=3364764 RepID=UPI0036D1B5D0